jgi:hypothetical protein
MREWLRKLWNDPVWSKVIANAIWATPTIYLWSKSNFSFSAQTAWSAAQSTLVAKWVFVAAIPTVVWRWLVSPVSHLPRLLAIFLSLVAASGWILLIGFLFGRKRGTGRVHVTADGVLGESQANVLKKLYEYAPKPINALFISWCLGISLDETEELIEGLKVRCLVWVGRGPPLAGNNVWLTPEGESTCVALGMERKAEPEPSSAPCSCKGLQVNAARSARNDIARLPKRLNCVASPGLEPGRPYG